MTPSASIIIPTRERPGYLEVALASVAPQARARRRRGDRRRRRPARGERRAGRRALGARYVALGEPRGLNAARNAGRRRRRAASCSPSSTTTSSVHDGWLAALIAAARSQPDVDVFTGPILARLEGSAARRRPAGARARRSPTSTSAPADRDVPRAWGANMAIRRRAFERVGRFDPHRRCWGGDEEEWQQRLLRRRRADPLHRRGRRSTTAARRRDATLRALMRGRVAARRREARDFDEEERRAPSLARELRVLAGCVLAHAAPALRQRAGHGGPQRRAHLAGARRAPRPRARRRRRDDFLSGESGTVGGRRDALRELADRALDLRALRRAAAACGRAARGLRRRVLVLSVVRAANDAAYRRAIAELRRSRCERGRPGARRRAAWTSSRT